MKLLKRKNIQRKKRRTELQHKRCRRLERLEERSLLAADFVSGLSSTPSFYWHDYESQTKADARTAEVYNVHGQAIDAAISNVSALPDYPNSRSLDVVATHLTNQILVDESVASKPSVLSRLGKSFVDAAKDLTEGVVDAFSPVVADFMADTESLAGCLITGNICAREALEVTGDVLSWPANVILQGTHNLVDDLQSEGLLTSSEADGFHTAVDWLDTTTSLVAGPVSGYKLLKDPALLNNLYDQVDAVVSIGDSIVQSVDFVEGILRSGGDVEAARIRSEVVRTLAERETYANLARSIVAQPQLSELQLDMFRAAGFDQRGKLEAAGLSESEVHAVLDAVGAASSFQLVLDSGILEITGPDDVAHSIDVFRDQQDSSRLLITTNGTTHEFSRLDVRHIVVVASPLPDDIVIRDDISTTVFAGAGDDRVIGGWGDDVVYGGEGVDEITVRSGDDFVDGGPEADKIWGGADIDIFVDAGGDTIIDRQFSSLVPLASVLENVEAGTAAPSVQPTVERITATATSDGNGNDSVVFWAFDVSGNGGGLASFEWYIDRDENGQFGGDEAVGIDPSIHGGWNLILDPTDIGAGEFLIGGRPVGTNFVAGEFQTTTLELEPDDPNARPDLLGLDIRVDPVQTVYAAEQEVEISFRIANVGGARADRFIVGLISSDDDAWDADDPVIAQKSFDGLQPDAKTGAAFKFTLPDGSATKNFALVVDLDGQIQEESENNNYFREPGEDFLAITFSGDQTNPGAPSIGTWTVSPDDVIRGEDVTVTATNVVDDGSVGTLRVVLDSNGNGSLDEGDQPVGYTSKSGTTFRGRFSTESWPLGTYQVFGQAIDNFGNTGVAATHVTVEGVGSAVPDAHERNNSRETAAPLGDATSGTIRIPNLSITTDDDDWFFFNMPAGEADVRVTIEFFEEASGQGDLYLYMEPPGGSTFFSDTSQPGNTQEQVYDHDALKGRYYIRVSGQNTFAGVAENDNYTLTVELLPQSGAADPGSIETLATAVTRGDSFDVWFSDAGAASAEVEMAIFAADLDGSGTISADEVIATDYGPIPSGPNNRFGVSIPSANLPLGPVDIVGWIYKSNGTESPPRRRSILVVENQPPQFQSISGADAVPQGEPVTLEIDVADPDTDGSIAGVRVMKDGATLANASHDGSKWLATIDSASLDQATHVLSAEATDNRGAASMADFSVEVSAPRNQAPQFHDIDLPEFVLQGDTAVIRFNVTDPDGDSISAAGVWQDDGDGRWDEDDTLLATAVGDGSYLAEFVVDGFAPGTLDLLIIATDTGEFPATRVVAQTLPIEERREIRLSLPDAVIVEGTNARLEVLRTGDLENPVTVTLLSSDTTELTVPQTVTIEAFETSASFEVHAISDGESDGGQPVTVSADALEFQGATAEVEVRDDAVFSIVDMNPTHSGLAIRFDRAIDATTVNLYDQGDLLGSPDLTVSRDDGSVVRGSLVFDADLQGLTFVQTGGQLAAGSYTVRLASGEAAFRDADGNLLDGDGDGIPGGDYVETFDISESPDSSVVVSLPDFVFGFGQPVRLPADDPNAGLPLMLSNGHGVSGLDLRLEYNPDLLTISDFVLDTSVAARGGQSLLTIPSPGTAILTVSGPNSLAAEAGPLVLGGLTAEVPTSALYGGKHIIDLVDLHVYDDGAEPAELPARDDDAIHIAAFFGDTNGSGSYNAPDVTLVQRIIGQINSGLSFFQTADPALIADITLNGKLQANDTASIQRVIGQLPVANVPPLPADLERPEPSGLDPRIYIPSDLTASPGDVLTVPVRMQVTEEAGITLSGFDIVIGFDQERFSVGNAQIGSLLDGAGFSGTLSNPSSGILIYTASSANGTSLLPLNTEGDLFTMSFTVASNAAAGLSPVNLRDSFGPTFTAAFDNDLSNLLLVPAPTDLATDVVDGAVTIAGSNLPPSVRLENVTTRLPENTSTVDPVKVADIVVEDDATGTNTLGLSGVDEGLFEIVGDALFLRRDVLLDFETKSSLSVTVSVDDPDVGTSPDDFAGLTIDVTDVNEAPGVYLSNPVTTLAEDIDTTTNLRVADIVIDDDALGDNSLRLGGPDHALFEIDSDGLYLRAGVTLDQSTNPRLDVSVEVDDAAVEGSPDGVAPLSIAVSGRILFRDNLEEANGDRVGQAPTIGGNDVGIAWLVREVEQGLVDVADEGVGSGFLAGVEPHPDEGSQYLRLHRPAGDSNSSNSVGRLSTAVDSERIRFSFRLHNKSASGDSGGPQAILGVGDGNSVPSDQTVLNLSFPPDGSLQMFDGTAFQTIAGPGSYLIDAWQQIELVIDLDHEAFEVYVEENLVAMHDGFQNSGFTTVSDLMFAPGSNVTAFVDGVSLVTEQPSPPTVVGIRVADDPVPQNERQVQHIRKIDVAFSHPMATTGQGSVVNVDNWVLEGDGVDLSHLITEITYAEDDAARHHVATLSLNPGLDDGRFVLTASSSITNSFGVPLDGDQDGVAGGEFLRKFTNAAPTAVGPEFAVNTTTAGWQGGPVSSPELVATDTAGNFVVVWDSEDQDGSGRGIFGQRFRASGERIGSEFQINTYTAADQFGPAVARAADGRFVATWTSVGQDGGGNGVYARVFDADGVPLGNEFRVSETIVGNQQAPSIDMDAAGNFIVAWDTYLTTTTGDVYARRFDRDGSPLTGEFRINSRTTEEQWAASVGVGGDGSFVVVWQSRFQDGDNFGIYGQRYDASTNPVGGEFRVNAVTAGQQSNPAIAVDSDGDFAVAWIDDRNEGDGYGVFARVYRADGTPLDGEFLVNSFTAGTQRYTSIAMDDDGDFVVGWASDGQDGSSTGVYIQRFNRLGVAQGVETRANTTIQDAQNNASLAMDRDGDFVVIWQSRGQDGDTSGLFGQRFAKTLNHLPNAVDDMHVVEQDAVHQPLDVLSNDNTHPDPSETLKIIGVDDSLTLGTVAIAHGGGLLLYSPPEGFLGTDIIGYTIDDGNGGQDVAEVTVDVVAPIENLVRFRIETTDLSGKKVTDVAVGETFQVRVLAEDLRSLPTGVFSGFVDLFYDPGLATSTEEIAHGIHFPHGRSGTLAAPGLIDETGAHADITPLGEGEFVLFTTSWTATAPGRLDLFLDPADEPTLHRVAVFDLDNYLAIEQVKYVGASLTIHAARPLAIDDEFNAVEDGTLIVPAVGVLLNDQGADGVVLSARLEEGTTNGIVELSGDGSFTYQPRADFHGIDQFTYRVDDGALESNLAVVSINVEPRNDAPRAADDSYEADEDHALIVDADAGLLANDFDADGDPLTAFLHDEPTNGIVDLAADGSFTYSPDADFNGQDQFTYRVQDSGASSEIATVTLSVHPVNDPPIAHDQTVSTPEDMARQITLTGEDGDPEVDQGLKFELRSLPSHGTVSLAAGGPPMGRLDLPATVGNGVVYYVPEADSIQTDSFAFGLTDDGGTDRGGVDSGSDGTITVLVEAINDPPIAVDDHVLAGRDRTLTVTAAEGILANDYDVDGDALTASLVTAPSSGTLMLEGDGSFQFIPAPGFVGELQFVYAAHDGEASSEATVTIQVVAPIAQIRLDIADANFDSTDRLVVGEHGNLRVWASDLRSDGADGVFSSYLDVIFDEDAVDFAGSIDFTERFGTARSGSFDERGRINALGASDDFAPPGPGEFLLATVPFMAESQGTTKFAGSPVVTSSDLSVLLFGRSTPVPWAMVNLVGDEVLVIPAVVGVDDGPIFVDEDTSDNVVDVLSNDLFDPEVGAIVTQVTMPEHGTVAVSADGSRVLYTPPNDYYGADSFHYTLTDGNGITGTARVSISVANTEDAPTANDDFLAVQEDTADNILDVLANDTFLPDPPESLRIVSASSLGGGGEVSVATDGSTLIYTPAPNFIGEESIRYTIEDEGGRQDSATATILVENADFDAQDDEFTIYANGNVHELDVLANDEPLLGSDAGVTIVDATQPAAGYVGIGEDGRRLLFWPLPQRGDVEFHYTATDGNFEASARVFVRVCLYWQNSCDAQSDSHLDVNADGTVSPLDALIIINRLNVVGHGELPMPPAEPDLPPPFYDTTGDNRVTPRDVLLVINELNGAGQAESEGFSSVTSERFFTSGYVAGTASLKSASVADTARSSLSRGTFRVSSVSNSSGGSQVNASRGVDEVVFASLRREHLDDTTFDFVRRDDRVSSVDLFFAELLDGDERVDGT